MVPHLESQQRAGRMSRDEAEKLLALRDAVSGDARGSDVYQYMWENYDAVWQLVNVERPNWKAFTRYLSEQGFKSARGGELTSNSVMKTFSRVKRRHDAQEASRRKREQPLSVSVPVVREDDRQVVERQRTASVDTEPVGEAGRSESAGDSVRKLKEQLGRRGAMPTPLRRE